MSQFPRSQVDTARFTVVVFAVGVVLTIWFWLDLWLGGGLVGGDLYSYYFPQKAYYADWLKQGVIPIWNRLVGHGYPVVGESQTGVYYPFNLLLYRFLPVNLAYNVNHLLHYVIAFVATAWLAREFGLSLWGSLLAGIVFVYGWFPPRCCHEWAVLTGAYLPLNLLLLVRYRRTGHLGWLWGLAGGVFLQILPGHYHLAFVTLLCLGLWMLIEFGRNALELHKPATTRSLLIPGLAIGLGFLMASVQLLPSWSLKQNSQREDVTAEYAPSYGHIPPTYLTQTFLPFVWYADASTLDERINGPLPFAVANQTNPVEAHLYFGLLPFLLMIWGVVSMCRIRNEQTRSLRLLGLLGLLAAIYATGWLVQIGRAHV